MRQNSMEFKCLHNLIDFTGMMFIAPPASLEKLYKRRSAFQHSVRAVLCNLAAGFLKMRSVKLKRLKSVDGLVWTLYFLAPLYCVKECEEPTIGDLTGFSKQAAGGCCVV